MKKTETIEEILKRLEAINVALSDEAIPLDKAMALYAEGATLSAKGSQKLENARLQIEEIALKITAKDEEIEPARQMTLGEEE